MNALALRVGLVGLVLGLTLAAAGCGTDGPDQANATAPAGPKPEPARKIEAGKNVWLEGQPNQWRVFVAARVCLREGMLEQLLCRKHTKEHEAILAADVDARDIHKALLVAGAEAGTPVRFEPQFRPPSGSRIKVTLRYEDKGKLVTVPAQRWVRDLKTRKDLSHDWVFAGSHLIEDPDDKNRPPFYAANDGNVICVSNFGSAMLDLPISSSAEDAERSFEAHTERIPPRDTPVTVILEPLPGGKKPDK